MKPKDEKDDLEYLKELLIGDRGIYSTEYTNMANITTSGAMLTEQSLDSAVNTLKYGSFSAQYTDTIHVDEASTMVQIPLSDGSKLVYEKSSGDYFISEKIDHSSTKKTGKEMLRGNMQQPLVKTLFEKIEGSDFGDIKYLLDPVELKIRTEVSWMSYGQAEKMLKDAQKWRKRAQLMVNKAKKPITREMKALKSKIDESVSTINIISEHLGNLTAEGKYVKKITLKQANDELDMMLELNKQIKNAL